jgi:hypothetical protein
LRPKSKMENRYLFAKNFARCLVPFCKMIGQNPKFFGWNGELNTPIIATSEYPSFWIELLRFNQNMTSLVIKKMTSLVAWSRMHDKNSHPSTLVFYFSVLELSHFVNFISTYGMLKFFPWHLQAPSIYDQYLYRLIILWFALFAAEVLMFCLLGRDR